MTTASRNATTASRAAVVLSLMLLSGSLLFGACSSDNTTSTPAVPRTAPAPEPAEAGTIDFFVTDEEDEPIGGVIVSVGADASRLGRYAITDESGRASISAPAGRVWIVAKTESRSAYRETAQIEPFTSTFHRVHLLPSDQIHSLALLPPVVAARTDPSGLQIDITLLAAGPAGFAPPSYGGTMPHLQFGDCWVTFDSSTGTPGCRDSDAAGHGIAAYSYDSHGAPARTGPDAITLLLVDQGLAAGRADPSSHRWRGARYFARTFRNNAPDRLLGVAGFSGNASSGRPRAPLLLPPAAGDDPAALFANEQDGPLRRLDPADYPGGDATDIADAVRAGITLLTEYAPGESKSLVILTGPLEQGVDDATFTSLAGLRRDSGVQVTLVSTGLPSSGDDRPRLAKLAAALEAAVIVAGYPTSWPEYGKPTQENGIVQAMGLAADYLTGASLTSIRASLLLGDFTGEGFAPGFPLQQQVGLDVGYCPWDCWLQPLHFYIRTPGGD